MELPPVARKAPHRNDRAPRMLFGKAYVWLQNESGDLSLMSVAAMREMLDTVRVSLDG